MRPAPLENRRRILPQKADHLPPANNTPPHFQAMAASADEIIYITSTEEMLWGGALVAATLTIHAFGMLQTLHASNKFKDTFGKSGSFAAGMTSLILASWMIIAVHVVEIMMWAGFFQWRHCFANYSTATYFSFLEYTTVGSAFNLPLRWRLLEGMIATAGLMGFAWSTGVLLTLAQEFQEQQLQRYKERDARARAKAAARIASSGAADQG
jgi:hypothetical protein